MKDHSIQLARALKGLLDNFVTVAAYPDPSQEISDRFINMASAETLARQALEDYEKDFGSRTPTKQKV